MKNDYSHNDYNDNDYTNDFEKATEYMFTKTKELASVVSNGNVTDVIVGFNPKTSKRMGECFYNNRTIFYGRHFVDLNKTNKRGLDNLIIHELSHFVDHTHGKPFKDNMKRFGFDADDDSEILQPAANKFMRCQSCGSITKPSIKIPQHYRKLKCASCGEQSYVPCRYDGRTREVIKMEGVDTCFNWISFVDKVNPVYEIECKVVD